MSAQGKGLNARNAEAPKKSSKPTPKHTTAKTPAARDLSKALKLASGASLVDVHRHVKFASEAGEEALMVIDFVFHDPDAIHLLNRNSWLPASCRKALWALKQLERSTEFLMDVFDPLVTGPDGSESLPGPASSSPNPAKSSVEKS